MQHALHHCIERKQIRQLSVCPCPPPLSLSSQSLSLTCSYRPITSNRTIQNFYIYGLLKINIVSHLISHGSVVTVLQFGSRCYSCQSLMASGGIRVCALENMRTRKVPHCTCACPGHECQRQFVIVNRATLCVSAAIAVVACLSVCHTPVLYRKG